jgi:hypothetical protein
MMRIILATIAFVMLATPSWGSDHNPEFEKMSCQDPSNEVRGPRTKECHDPLLNNDQ